VASTEVAGIGAECGEHAGSLQSEYASATRALQTGLAAFAGEDDAFAALRTGVELVGERLVQDAERLCGGLDAPNLADREAMRRRACLADARTALETMGERGGDAQALGDARSAAWALEGNLYQLEQALECPPPLAPSADAHPSRAFRKRGSLHLVAGENGPEEPVEVAVDAFLLCQRRKSDGTYEDVTACNRAELTQGDRVYLFGYNDSGQFQMLFPDPTIRNQVEPEHVVFLPSGEDWLELDDVGGVREYVHLVAAAQPVAELEALRGIDVPPNESQATQERTRGLLEPLITRGFTQRGGPITLEAGGRRVSTVPVVVSELDVVGVEFEIIHR
jgi:hypothetical protein